MARVVHDQIRSRFLWSRRTSDTLHCHFWLSSGITLLMLCSSDALFCGSLSDPSPLLLGPAKVPGFCCRLQCHVLIQRYLVCQSVLLLLARGPLRDVGISRKTPISLKQQIVIEQRPTTAMQIHSLLGVRDWSPRLTHDAAPSTGESSNCDYTRLI